MGFQDWTVAQIKSLRDTVKKLIDGSKSISELDEKQDVLKGDYVPVYSTEEKETNKYDLSKLLFLIAGFQKSDEIDKPNGYVGLNSQSKINPDFLPELSGYRIKPVAGTKKYQLLKGKEVISEIDLTPYWNHINNSSIHVTQQEKEDWSERYSLIPISGTKKFQLLKGEQVISEIDMTPYFEQIIALILSDKEALQEHINDQGVHFTAQEKQDLESRLEGKVSYLKAENLTDEQKRVAQYNMGLLNHKHPYLELLGGVLTGRTEMAVNYHTVMFGNEKTLVHKEYLEKWSKGQFLKKEDYLGVQVIQYWSQVTSFSLNKNRPGAKVGTILVNEDRKELYVKMSDQEWHSVQTSKI